MTNLRSRATRGLTVIVGAAALAAGVLGTANPAAAQWRHHGGGDVGAGVAAGVIGGLAAGAIAGAAANGGYYAAPAYDAGYGDDCYFQRQRVWDGYAWRVQRVRVCE